MPVVNVDLNQLSGIEPGDKAVTNAWAWFTPYRPYHVESGGDDYLMTTEILKVKCVEGVAAPVLPETPLGEAVWVQLRQVRVRGGSDRWLVQIPATDCNLFDLPHLDEGTLDPTAPPSPAWLAEAEALAADIGTAQSTADAAQSTADGAVTSLATKVNTSTYTAGLAAKADQTALDSEAAARVAADALKADASALATETTNRINADATKVDATAAGKATLAVVENSKLWPFRAALGRRDTDLVNVGILGASSTEGAFVGAFDRTISSRLATLLRNRYPTKGLTGGGRGFVGVPSKELTTSAQYTAGMWPQAYTGGLFDPASAGAASAFDLGAKHMCWYSNVGTAKVVHTLSAPVTSFEIHHAVGASGGATTGYYKIDGGSAVVFATNLTGSNIITVASAATTSIEVGWNAAGYIIFTGIREYASDETKGIQVHNLGHSGMKIADWQDGYAVANSWRTAIAALNLDLLVLHDLGANDAFAALTPAQVKTALVAYIAVLRSGGITCPIVLSAMFDPSGGAAVTPSWAAYATIMREIADADSTIVFVDHSVRMPSTAITDTLALYSTIDHVHARADGAVNQWIASTYDAILAAA